MIWSLDDAADLARIPALIEWIHPAGALWAVWPKGRKELNENHIREAALDAGLVDVKVARFSATHSALKLVVPKAKRGQSARPVSSASPYDGPAMPAEPQAARRCPSISHHRCWTG